MKKLKIWNGHGHGKFQNGHFYVAAYSQRQAAELVGKAAGYISSIGIREIREYYSANCWGNVMEGITPTEPCVYATTSHYDRNPKRIL